MKLNIYVFEQEKLGGEYFNFPLKDYASLDNVSDTGECEEVRLNLSLNYVDLGAIPSFLHNISAKIEFGGKLFASSTDIIELARSIYFRQVDDDTKRDIVEIANELIFRGNKNLLSIEYLDKQFKNAGLEILSKRTANYGSHIVGRVPYPRKD